MTEPVPGDVTGALVEERIVLEKFDGEVSEADITSGKKKPVEKIVIKDGEVIEHWKKEDK